MVWYFLTLFFKIIPQFLFMKYWKFTLYFRLHTYTHKIPNLLVCGQYNSSTSVWTLIHSMNQMVAKKSHISFQSLFFFFPGIYIDENKVCFLILWHLDWEHILITWKRLNIAQNFSECFKNKLSNSILKTIKRGGEGFLSICKVIFTGVFPKIDSVFLSFSSSF